MNTYEEYKAYALRLLEKARGYYEVSVSNLSPSVNCFMDALENLSDADNSIRVGRKSDYESKKGVLCSPDGILWKDNALRVELEYTAEKASTLSEYLVLNKQFLQVVFSQLLTASLQMGLSFFVRDAAPFVSGITSIFLQICFFVYWSLVIETPEQTGERATEDMARKLKESIKIAAPKGVEIDVKLNEQEWNVFELIMWRPSSDLKY